MDAAKDPEQAAAEAKAAAEQQAAEQAAKEAARQAIAEQKAAEQAAKAAEKQAAAEQRAAEKRAAAEQQAAERRAEAARKADPSPTLVPGAEPPGPPKQEPLGTVDLWPVLRDASLLAWVEGGEVDAVLYELYTLARSHDPAIAAALRRRAEVVGLSLEGPPAPRAVEVKPFRAPRPGFESVTKGS